ncbi:MAG TPA: hypothetical protein PK646_01255 [Bacillota bacterium]|jgi:hypothetical protein|nr:hypothetical protein [Fastidiosipila sp.]HPX92901.1 hypothetical protein [Bacillota bacterium]HQB80709.1 hypothetical protein [Bacillota bacterium]
MDSTSIFMVIMVATGIVAAGVIALLAAGILKNRRLTRSGSVLADEAVMILTSAQRGGTLPADAVAEVFANAEREDFRLFGEEMGRISQANFEGRLLPDPQPVMKARGLLQPAPLLAAGRLYALISFSVGTLWLVLALLISMMADMTGRVIPPALAAFLLSVTASLIIYGYAVRTARHVDKERDRVVTALSGYLPVFTDRTGVALLVSELIGYGEKMRGEVKAFSELANELAKGEFAEGISISVREIMSQEVAPSLQEANHALTGLARSLAEKQEKGMTELAGTFSSAVAEALSVHLSSLPDKLQTLYQVAENSARMMEESVTTMERTRLESQEVVRDVQETLRLMALAKNDMADEMAAISDNLEIMGTSTEKMTALYSGQETNLVSHIDRLSDLIRLHADRLGEGIVESAKTIEASVRMSASQNKSAAILLERLDEQLAALEELGRQITGNTINFTKESSGFVTKTLEEFDVSLAEIVERLTFTTAEIRDAIDALPAAIRGGPGQ